MGLSRKNCTPKFDRICSGYQFFEVDPLDFQLILYWPPEIFHLFTLTPLNILVFPSNFDSFDWDSSQLLSLYLPGNFHWYPHRGVVSIFFLEKPNSHELPVNCLYCIEYFFEWLGQNIKVLRLFFVTFIVCIWFFCLNVGESIYD